jgi:hypothetical protein
VRGAAQGHARAQRGAARSSWRSAR